MLNQKKIECFFNIITVFFVFIFLTVSHNCAIMHFEEDLDSYNKTDKKNKPESQTVSIKKNIISFVFESSKNITVLSIDAIGIIGIDTVDITVPFGTDLSSLIPTIIITGTSISPGNNVAQTFTDGVGSIYTVTGSDGSTKNYTVIVRVAANNAKDITSFVFTSASNSCLSVDITGVITGTNIDILVPAGTDISTLTPTISISGVSINPASNTSQAFSDGTGVTYTVTAADASTKIYTVTVFKPPTAGGGGIISFTDITKNSITVNWIKATDDQTPQADLQYLVYYSNSNNIDTVANIEANGTPAGTYTPDINTKLINGLSDTSLFYFNIIVKDQNNNKTAYNMNSQSTTDTIPPIAGNSGILTFSDIKPDSITVNWTKATDNITLQENLQYLLYYSENSSSVNTVTSMENTGTPVGAYSADINSITVPGLSNGITYYFNVIVKDEAGNKTAYSKNSQLTGDGEAPEVGGSGIIDTVSYTNAVMLVWTKATDNVTLQENLQYLVYYSTVNNIDTVANAEANGTAFGSYATCVTPAKAVTGLIDSTTYYFNIIVKDEAGNKNAYTMTAAATLDGTPPVAGNNGALTFSNITSNSITVNWTKATDNISAQSDLEYLVYYSTSNNINTVANAEANGTAFGSYTADIDTRIVTGLVHLKCYYFNVIVQDEAGNKTAYAMNGRLTLSGVPSLTPTVGPALTTVVFNSPQRMVIVGSYIYVTDWNDHTVSRVDITTGAVTVFAGSTGVSGSANGYGTDARFTNPSGICSDGTNLYVGEGGGRLRKIVISTGEVTTLEVTSISMYGLVTDGINIYIAYYGNSRIEKYNIATGSMTTFAGSVTGYQDGIGTAAQFRYIQDICTDGTYLYVSDYLNYRIRKIDLATAEVTTLAGSGTNSSADGTGIGASFRLPRGIETDGTYVYVAEPYGRVRKIEIATGVVTTIASTLGNPTTDVVTDGVKLYISDDGNNNIQSIQ